MNIKKIVSAVSTLAIAVSAFAGLAVTASAAGYTRTLTDKLEIAGYKAETLYDFQNNSPEVLPTSGDLRYRDGGNWGLHNYGAGSRSGEASIPVSKGDLLVLEIYSNDYIPTIDCGTKNDALTSTYSYQVYDITSDSETVTFTVPRYGGIIAALVMNVDTSVTTASYTANYVCDGNTIKSVPSEGIVGEIPVLDKSDITTDDGKYSYVSDDTETVGGVASDGTTVYTLTYEAVPTFTATVNAVVDGSGTIGTYTSTAYQGETARVYYPKYIENNGAYYVTAANASYPSYGKDFTTEDSADVSYTASDVAYAAEIEDLSPSHAWAAAGSVPERYSAGAAERLYKQSYVKLSGWTASKDSEVTVALWARNQSGSSEGSISVYTADSEGNLTDTGIDIGSWSTSENAEKSAAVTVPAGSSIVLYDDTEYNSNLEMDYVALTVTKESEDEPAAPAFAIDLGDAIEANGTGEYAEEVATAYIATVTNEGAYGTASSISVTANDTTLSQGLSLTLAKDAAAYIGLILNNVSGSDTVTAAIE